MKKVNELTNSPPPDDAPAARGAGGADMMGLLSSMVRAVTHGVQQGCRSGMSGCKYAFVLGVSAQQGLSQEK